jgi:hypothetical protein
MSDPTNDSDQSRPGMDGNMVRKTYREVTTALSAQLPETMVFEALSGIAETGFLGVLQRDNAQLAEEWEIQFGESLELMDPGSNPNEHKSASVDVPSFHAIASALNHALPWLETAANTRPADEALSKILNEVRSAHGLAQTVTRRPTLSDASRNTEESHFRVVVDLDPWGFEVLADSPRVEVVLLEWEEDSEEEEPDVDASARDATHATRYGVKVAPAEVSEVYARVNSVWDNATAPHSAIKSPAVEPGYAAEQATVPAVAQPPGQSPSDIESGLAWIEAGATQQDLEALKNLGGYAPIFAGYSHPGPWAERLDELLKQRVLNVRNELRRAGWGGPKFGQLRVESDGLLLAFDHRAQTAGRGDQWTALIYRGLQASGAGTEPTVETLVRVQDQMVGSAAMMAQEFRARLQRALQTHGISVELRTPYETLEAQPQLTATSYGDPARSMDPVSRQQEVSERLELLGFEMRYRPEAAAGEPPVLTWLWDGEPAVNTGPVSRAVSELAQEWYDLDAYQSNALQQSRPKDNAEHPATDDADDGHGPPVN